VCTAGGFAKEASLSDSTVAVDFFSFSFAPEDSAPDSRVRLQVWDMSGRAEYEEVRTELYASARESHQVVMLVFNVSQRASFEALAGWARKVHESVPGLVPFVVAANQCDRKQRQVPAEEAAKWCRDRGFALVETSAVTGCGVHELFRAACTVARVCKG
jgi:GTPase SAR1 family protein